MTDLPGRYIEGPPHLILVGLPGSGKTTVGRRVAEALGRRFVDFDEEIVRREGRSVAELFAAEGEAYFRQREAELTRELAAESGAILSPGGGWIMQPGLLEILRPPAVMIHLRASPATALRRLGPAVAERPLLSGSDPGNRISALWEARRTAYAAADFELDTEPLDRQEVSDAVLELIRRSV